MKIYYSPTLHATIGNAHCWLRFQNFLLRFPILTHTVELHDDHTLDI